MRNSAAPEPGPRARALPAETGHADPRHAPPAARAPRGLILAACCSALFMTGLDNTIVTVALPGIGHALRAPVSGLQWVSAGYTVALASLLIFSGAAADRLGRRACFLAGLALFTLGSWLCSLAPGLAWLIAFRVLQGTGGSLLAPPALGIIADVFPGRADRARAIGIWDGVLGVSMALGPVLGGILISCAGWKAVFWANVPVGLAAGFAAAVAAPESRARTARRPDPAAQALVIILLASLAYGIIQAPADGWTSVPVTACWAAAAASAAALPAWERRRPDPLIDFGVFRSIPLACAVTTAVTATAALSGFLFLTTLYLQDVRGFSPLHAGLVILPMPAAMAACSPLSGRIVARRGSRIPLAAAGTALAAASLALAGLTAGSGPVFLAAVYALFGCGTGMVNSPVTAGVMGGIPPDRAGMASGLNSSARQTGQALGVAVAGTLLAARLSSGIRAGFLAAAHPAWQLMTGCGCLVLVLGLAATTRRAAATAELAAAPPEAGHAGP